MQRSPPVALEVSCRCRPRVFYQQAQGQSKIVATSSRDVVGGCCPSDLRDRAGAACPPGPQLHRSSVEPPVPQSVNGPCLVGKYCITPHHVILFVCPAEPAGALGFGAAPALLPSRSGSTGFAAANWEELPCHDAAPWLVARKSSLSSRCFLPHQSFLSPTAPKLLSCILADTPRRTGLVHVAPGRMQIPYPSE